MAVVIQSSLWRDEGSSGGTTCIADKPSGVTSGDLLLIIAFCDSTAAGPEFSDNLTDWTFEGSWGGTGSDVHIGLFSKTATGSESATETISFVTTSYRGAAYLRIDGHNSSAWKDALASGEDTVAGTNITVGEVTSTVDDCLIIYALGSDGLDTGALSLNTANGWTNTDDFIVDEYGPTGTPSAGGAVSIGSRTLASLGGAGAASVTLQESDTGTYIMFSVAPAAGGTTDVNFSGSNRGIMRGVGRGVG